MRLLNRGRIDLTLVEYAEQLLGYWEYWAENSRDIFHPTHRTEDEKRLLRNKRARLKRKKKKEL